MNVEMLHCDDFMENGVFRKKKKNSIFKYYGLLFAAAPPSRSRSHSRVQLQALMRHSENIVYFPLFWFLLMNFLKF